LRTTLETIAWSHLHWRAGSSFTAIRKGAGLVCGSFLREGGVLAYVGLFQNLKDLKLPFGKDENKQGFPADHFYARARCWPVLGELKT